MFIYSFRLLRPRLGAHHTLSCTYYTLYNVAGGPDMHTYFQDKAPRAYFVRRILFLFERLL